MIGFIQGRLSPIVDGKIQAFPWNHWINEFSLAERNNFNLIEWTLDQELLYENPLMTKNGQNKIKDFKSKYKIAIDSLTGDCLMQAPFFKYNKKKRDDLLDDLQNIIKSCDIVGVKYIVYPLVDNGKLENKNQERVLIEGLKKFYTILSDTGIKIVFESDFSPQKLKRFIEKFPSESFGINYDIGNSASLGYNNQQEIEAYGDRIFNVHVKDRLLHGDTVPLGHGDADIPGAINELKAIGYDGNYVLQTARAKDSDHLGVLCKYRDQLVKWIS